MTTTQAKPTTIAESLIEEIRSEANYNSNVQVAPACILWPDGDRQFEPVIDRLLSEMPELCVLGDYVPDRRTGPAIWLRMVIADRVDETKIPPGKTPVIYLPGIRRQDLRAVDDCPEALKPLAELQYRGSIWSQVNNKDWTILAFLSSKQGGLGLDVAQDNGTKNCLRPSLYRVLDERVDLLENKRLDQDYFNGLLSGGDPIKNLLIWINDPPMYRNECDTNAWNGFAEICKSQFKIDPVADGEIQAAYLLAEQAPPWNAVWDRYAEAPHRYPNIPDQIRKTSPPKSTGLFDDHSGWPQWNDSQEADLLSLLSNVKDQSEQDARKAILDADANHRVRRELVWAELGHSPLAMAAEHLADLARITSESMAGGTAEEVAAAYADQGYKADDAVLSALGCVREDKEFEAVAAAINAIYTPWCEQAALHLQAQVEQHEYPGGSLAELKEREFAPGTCVLFVDGMRYDLGVRLCDLLQERDHEVCSSRGWSTLPSVTASAKAAVTPVSHLVEGADVNEDFYPSIAETGKIADKYNLDKLLADNDWQQITKTEYGDPSGIGWSEIGDIDKKGHQLGWKVARSLNSILQEIVDFIDQLFAVGWNEVQIVTDHGFLLIPSGLPESKLAPSLAVNKWGRCAAIKPGANTQEKLYPWFWNPSQSFALASGVSSYKKRVYTHGGLSVHECVIMGITVTNASVAAGNVQIKSVTWKQLRCTVELLEPVEGIQLDMRTHAGNPTTSEASKIKPFNDKPRCSVIVEDDDLVGHRVFVVIVDSRGNALAQQETVVGGDG
ncbi:BREX-1 system phosphatase PglZ type B [Rubinisphaera sp.]|uniref:BREX-1 system phosphatase PglZ type B n=1 Tax=Rubinisphaera sp. TaxID=2024857 RepID=UPI000C111267|nr:BREX-1 system phosphatase PglZ type B [Rubinisphaera sp.]MBV08937.1 alkaline phosphatase [Rubinisphaera sp.]|tara:strand:- start:897 stop:3248 length:2352 start_codon:yes stop_codon:yes gene_type:complete